jgi:hypothetical protein
MRARRAARIAAESFRDALSTFCVTRTANFLALSVIVLFVVAPPAAVLCALLIVLWLLVRAIPFARRASGEPVPVELDSSTSPDAAPWVLPPEARDPAWSEAARAYLVGFRGEAVAYFMVRLRVSARRTEQEAVKARASDHRERNNLHVVRTQIRALADISDEVAALERTLDELSVTGRRLGELAYRAMRLGGVAVSAGTAFDRAISGMQDDVARDLVSGVALPVDRPFRLWTDCSYGHLDAHVIVCRDGGKLGRECRHCVPVTTWMERV